jgi:diaminopimelate decarboxylase
MHDFKEQDGQLYCEQVPVAKIAKAVGTPCYIYSHQTLTRHFTAVDGAFASIPHVTAFAMKANSNLAILRLFASLGGGADIVSGGELYRALKAGVPRNKIVFAGVGKTREEIAEALKAKILLFNVESAQELAAIDEVARKLKTRARISLRVNPHIDPKTHPYISTGLKKSKFGIGIDQALEHYKQASTLRGIEVVGVHHHIGSQLTQVQPFVEALARVLELVDTLKTRGVVIRTLDMGGGLGIPYKDELPPSPQDLANAVLPLLRGRDLTLILEPGRVLVGNAGILVTKALYTKEGAEKSFVVVDAGMNDLLRPALYAAHHRIEPVTGGERARVRADVVGPVCETGDFLARDRELAEVRAGELLAVRDAGAYAFAMSSNYNLRPRAAEALMEEGRPRLLRRRETFEDLMRTEDGA